VLIEEKLSEVLELIRTSEAKNKIIKLEEIAHELDCSILEVEKVVQRALSEGLLKRDDGTLKLTNEGYTALQRHRERYVHEKFRHRPGFMDRVARFFEGGIKDWRGHWRRRHGLDEKSINGFYKDIRDLEGRIEETSPLTNLNRGEKGIVAFAVGGRGLVRRLTEMGLTPGTEVTIVRSAPFHGPLEIEVRGFSLALGYGVASKVFVKRSKEAD